MDHILISNEGLDYSDAPPKIERNTKYNCQRQTPTTEIVGKSKKLLLALDQIRRFSDLSECVLIEGETGTGKELAARQLHQQGRWKSGPFVAINCAAIQSSLVQAELFGHEMGAFTDAKRTRPGLVSEAEGGSLFLDEINSLSMECQGALLRFLDDRTYRRLGSDQLRRSRVRIIAATNSDLTAKMKNGVFREDLWYRLKKLTLRLPPLRDRRDDIESLAHYFMEKHIRNEPFLNLRKFDENLLSWMKHYSWPGNVRELENVVFQWLVGECSQVIQAGGVGSQFTAAPAEEIVEHELLQSYRSAQVRWQRRYLTNLYNTAGGVISEAARTAQIDRSALRRLFKKHGIVAGNDALHVPLDNSNTIVCPVHEDILEVRELPVLTQTAQCHRGGRIDRDHT